MPKFIKPADSIPVQLIYYNEKKITADKYKTFSEAKGISPSDSVFIFPSNMTHHKNHSLYSKKDGANLAEVAGKIGDEGLPVLGLPTLFKDDELKQKNKYAKDAVRDIWRAIGFGKNIILPVRPHTSDKYFTKPLKLKDAPDLEPSFWGGVVENADKVFADEYVRHLNLIKSFLDGNEVKIEQDLIDAFIEGQNQAKQQNPTISFYQQPTPAVKLTPPSQQLSNANDELEELAKPEGISVPVPLDEENESEDEEDLRSEVGTESDESDVEIKEEETSKYSLNRPSEILTKNFDTVVKGLLVKKGWTCSKLMKEEDQEPYRTITKDKQRFDIYASKLTTNDNNPVTMEDTFRMVLETFQKMHPNATPKIKTQPGAEKAWENALKVVYPKLKSEDVISAAKAEHVAKPSV